MNISLQPPYEPAGIGVVDVCFSCILPWGSQMIFLLVFKREISGADGSHTVIFSR
jgi:hypothetical protein